MKAHLALMLLALYGCSTSSSSPPAAPDGGGDSASPDASPLEGGGGDAAADGPVVANCNVRPTCQGCLADGGVCCITPNASPPPETLATCNGCASDAGAMAVILGCTGAGDCPGAACCIGRDATGGFTSACAASCGSGQAQLCDSNAAVTTCPASAPCTRATIDAWNLAHCFGTCGAMPPPP